MNTAEMINKIKSFVQDRQFRFVIVFGSAAVGKMKPTSDIDIAILQPQAKPLTSREFFDLMDQLGSIFAAETKKIDLVDLAKANPLLRYEIVTGGILLYGDELDYAHYQIFARRDYMDSQSLVDLEKHLITKRQQFIATALSPVV